VSRWASLPTADAGAPRRDWVRRMRERLKYVVADVFDCAFEDVPDDADPDTLAGWDSLRHLEMMLALETEFGVRIPTETMLELSSLEKIEDYLCEHAAEGRT
jgi:acyl carrier protein